MKVKIEIEQDLIDKAKRLKQIERDYIPGQLTYELVDEKDGIEAALIQKLGIESLVKLMDKI